MRLIEFASAEDQIELWKLVSASVWSSLQQQQHQQRQAQATAAAGRAKRDAPSHKGKRKRATGKGRLKLPSVSIPSPKAAPQPTAPQAQAAGGQSKAALNVSQQSVQQNQQLPKPNIQNQRSVPQATAHAGKVHTPQPAVAIPNAVLPVPDAAVGADNRAHQANVVPTRVPVNTVRQRGATGPENAKRR
jgi:hypothetical protein